jgi:hypothetical protein
MSYESIRAISGFLKISYELVNQPVMPAKAKGKTIQVKNFFKNIWKRQLPNRIFAI